VKSTINALAYVAAAAIVVALVETYVIVHDKGERVYMHGSSSNPHDVAIGDLVDAPTSFGLYCDSEVAELMDAVEGDVVISGRVNSYECQYAHPSFLSYPIIGGGNYDEDMGDYNDPDSLFITNGGAYGLAVDFYIPEGNLGDAMASMANTVLAINDALDSPLDVRSLKQLLRDSADGERIVDGKYYGWVINRQRAVEWAVRKPVHIAGSGYLPAVYYILEN